MHAARSSPNTTAKAIAPRPFQTARMVRLPPLLLSSGPLTVPISRQGAAQMAVKIQADRTQASDCLDLKRHPPDRHLIDAFGANFCLRENVLPWRQSKGATIVAVNDVTQRALLTSVMPPHLPPLHIIRLAKPDIEKALLRAASADLVTVAETRVTAGESSRTLSKRLNLCPLLFLMAAGGAVLFNPLAVFTLFLSVALFALFLNTTLKIIAGVLALKDRPDPIGLDLSPNTLPVFSILVPLFRETQITTRLVARLKRLDYPRDKLDILLIVEEDDVQTRAVVGAARLPTWIRVITVPPGSVKTKPRALNYALDFCRGSIVGVYDAEDAPEPAQLRQVAARFACADAETACLQGALDFYNTRSNWLSRCFSIEYATWFRVILPGLQKMGLPIPLGGTTLFFRRDVLEELGGWDAHNVTEDADLGIRLARHGYRTELIKTVTQEEATCRPWPWVRQRSRWLKGYAVTWLVHMRAPAKLWRDLGPWGFLGVQVLFLGTLSQFLLAPFLWSFWLLLFGLPHPLAGVLEQTTFILLAAFFLLAELIGVFVGALAVAKSNKRYLMAWTPGMMLYMPMATLAAYRGLWDLIRRPFYWDKTTHGVTLPDRDVIGLS